MITGQFVYPLGLRALNLVPLEQVAPLTAGRSCRLSRMSHTKWQSLQSNVSVEGLYQSGMRQTTKKYKQMRSTKMRYFVTLFLFSNLNALCKCHAVII